MSADVALIKSSTGYRLPTQAEWEFACRAGTRTVFSFGETVNSDQASFDGLTPYNGAAKGQFRKRPLEVDALAPNRFGLYQMVVNGAGIIMAHMRPSHRGTQADLIMELCALWKAGRTYALRGTTWGSSECPILSRRFPRGSLEEQLTGGMRGFQGLGVPFQGEGEIGPRALPSATMGWAFGLRKSD